MASVGGTASAGATGVKIATASSLPFTRRFAYELAQLAIREQGSAPLPLLINLRDWPTKASLADVLHDHWHARTGERRDPAIFLHLLARGRLVLILDSFDEMGVAQAYRNVVEQFRGLVSATAADGDGQQANRILITCRDQFFRDREDATRAVAGHTDTLAPLEQAARAFAGRIDTLPRFDDAQIQDYLQTQGIPQARAAVERNQRECTAPPGAVATAGPLRRGNLPAGNQFVQESAEKAADAKAACEERTEALREQLRVLERELAAMP